MDTAATSSAQRAHAVRFEFISNLSEIHMVPVSLNENNQRLDTSRNIRPLTVVSFLMGFHPSATHMLLAI